MSDRGGWLTRLSDNTLGRLNLERWIEFTSRLFIAKPRRYFWVFLTLSIFCAWGGFRDFIETGKSAKEHLGEVIINQEGIKVSGLAILEFLNASIFSLGMGKFIVAALLSFLICAADTGFTTQRIKEMLHFTADDNLNTLLLVLSQCGIARAYRTETLLQTTKQHYASDICAKVSGSKSIKIMSIAGFEYIGAGVNSLLYSVIEKRPDMEAEFVLLDADKAGHVLADRVHRLRERDPTVTEETLKGHIAETKRLLGGLRTSRTASFSLWLCSCPTVFRLIILDDCLFVSAYKSNAHGHESPMLKINKHDTNGSITDWFDAFNQMYTVIKSRSNQYF